MYLSFVAQMVKWHSDAFKFYYSQNVINARHICFFYSIICACGEIEKGEKIWHFSLDPPCMNFLYVKKVRKLDPI